MPGTTVVQKLYQGNIRHRGVFDGGALFGYFLGKQKVTKKTVHSNVILESFIDSIDSSQLLLHIHHTLQWIFIISSGFCKTMLFI